MAAAETARLIASLELKDKLSGPMKSATGSVSKFETKWDKVSGKVKKGIAIAGGGLALFAGSQIRDGLESLTQVENAVSQVDGAIREVAPTWRTTGAEIAAAANRVEERVEAAFDDKDILRGAGALIRYGKLSESNLEPALEVMTDLAARTGSVDSASEQLAKALAAPEKAAGKLARVGVILTKQQQKQIEAMVEAGDVAGAQKVLLESLASTTRGAARDLYGPAADAQNELNDAVEDGQKLLAEGFLPVIKEVREVLRDGLADERTKRTIREIGKGLAAGVSSFIDIAKSLPWGAIGESLRIGAEGAKTIVGAFASLPPWVQTAVITSWGLNKLTGGAVSGIVGQLASGLVKGVLGINAGVVNINAGAVRGGGVPGLPAAGAAGAAAGISTAAALVPIAAAVATTVISTMGFAERNNAQERSGMTQAERIATNYYAADAAHQQNIFKRLVYTPDIEDATNRGLDRLKEQADRTKDDTVAATERVKLAAQETKRETARGLSIVASTQRSSAAGIEAAIRSSRSIVNVTVPVRVTATGFVKATTLRVQGGATGNSKMGYVHR